MEFLAPSVGPLADCLTEGLLNSDSAILVGNCFPDFYEFHCLTRAVFSKGGSEHESNRIAHSTY